MTTKKENKPTKESGDLNIDARINVKYGEGQPKIVIEYPNNYTKSFKRATKVMQYISVASSFLWVFMLILLGFIICYSFFSSIAMYVENHNSFDRCMNDMKEHYSEISYNTCQFYVSGNNYEENLTGMEIFQYSGIQPIRLLYLNYDGTSLRNYSYILLGIIGLSILLTIIFYKPLNEHKLKKAVTRKYMMFFRPEHIKQENGRWFCEIPSFNNYFLSYECEGEFNSYLSEVEVIEHPFWTKCSLTKPTAKKYNELDDEGKQKLLKEKNLMTYNDKFFEYKPTVWRGRFYFTQKPKTGCMKVEFK